ncbi:MAG: hypothetical protein KDD48_06840 [Bdellovibrionales bacterium]|nr:hypothetical protein [Bdellovibrionales bacterium]
MRITLAAQWADQPKLIQFGNWPPLFSVIYGAIIRVIPFPMEVGHVLTALCSSLVVFLSALFSKMVFRSFPIAILTAVLITFNSLHLSLAASMLSEPFYTALLLAFLMSAWKWSMSHQRQWLWCAIFFGILMTMLRTDGTPIVLVFGLWLIWRQPGWKSVGILLLLLTFPLLWVSILWKEFASLPTLLKLYAEDSRRFYASVPYWNWIPLLSLCKFFLLGLISMSILLGLWKRIDQHARAIVLIALFCAISQLYLLWNRVSTVFPERTLYTVGILFTIIEAFAVYSLWKIKPRLRILVAFALILHFAFQIYFGKEITPNYSQKMVDIGNRLKSCLLLQSNLKTQRIATDLEDARYGVVAAISGAPGRFTRFQFDSVNHQVSIKDPKPIPKYFLVGSEEAAKYIRGAWKTSAMIKLQSLWFISDNQKVIFELTKN